MNDEARWQLEERVKAAVMEKLSDLIYEEAFDSGVQRLELVFKVEGDGGIGPVTVISYHERDTMVFTIWTDSILRKESRWEAARLPRGTGIALPGPPYP